MRELMADSKEVIIDIIGVIGWEVWYTKMRDMLRAIPEGIERVVFEIYSPGGDVWEGNAICQEIGAMKHETVARVQVAASMATLIAIACKTREIAANGRWLIHNPWTLLAGDAQALEKRAKELRDCEQEAAVFYAKRTGKTAEEMLKLMAEERWLTPGETKDLGFVQKINDNFAAAAFAGVKAEIVAAGKWPKALVELPDETQEETQNANASTTGTESAGKAATTDAVGSANASELQVSKEYADGVAKGRLEADADHAGALTAIGAKMANLKKNQDELYTLQRRTQGERDSARAQVEKLGAALAETTAQIERLLGGGMNFSPALDTWEEALKECGNNYEQARKKYPELYQQRREQDKASRHTKEISSMKKIIAMAAIGLMLGSGIAPAQSTVSSYSAPNLISEINAAITNIVASRLTVASNKVIIGNSSGVGSAQTLSGLFGITTGGVATATTTGAAATNVALTTHTVLDGIIPAVTSVVVHATVTGRNVATNGTVAITLQTTTGYAAGTAITNEAGAVIALVTNATAVFTPQTVSVAQDLVLTKNNVVGSITSNTASIVSNVTVQTTTFVKP